MLSVKAVYDGKELKFENQISINTPHEVIVTFLDDTAEDTSSAFVQAAAATGGGLKFLDSLEEDIYSDSDLKVKY